MAMISFGTTLKKGDVAIGEISDIKGPSLSANLIDVTDLSNADGYRKYMNGLKDGGEVDVEGFLNPSNAGQVGLVSELEAGTQSEYVIEFPDGAKWTFDAIVTGFETGATLEDGVSFSAKLKVCGRPVLTAGASGVDALELTTIDPADNEDNVELNAEITLTFNNKIKKEAVVVTEDDGTIVAGTKEWDETGKILTFIPSSSLKADTGYIVVVAGVIDVYGQELAPAVKNFTT